MKMRHFTIILFLLVVTNSYAQKVIPFDSNLINELVRYMEMTDPTISDAINKTESRKGDYLNDELIVIYDIMNSCRMNKVEEFNDFGMYIFVYPMAHPSWTYVFLKYKDEIVIIEDDMEDNIFNEKGNGLHLIKQVEFLARFFAEHQDISRSYFATCTRHLIDIYEQNRTILE